MKPTLHTSSLALLALTLVACKSSDQGEATGATITRAADQIDLGIQELEATVAALHALTDNPATDLTSQSKAFDKALSALESTAQDVADTSAEMKAKGQAYFQKWEAELASIKNEDIRESSAERRKTIEASFSSLRNNYTEAKSAFEPLLDDLRDIRTALKADLTLSGIETLKSVAKKVDKESGSVSKELKEVADGFRELGLNLSRKGPEQKK